MRIGQTSFIFFISKILSSALGFVATLVFARIVGAEVLGYYAIILVVSKWLRLGGEIGIASAVNKRMSEGREKSEFFTAGLLLVALFGIVAALGVLVFRGRVNAYIGTDAAYFVAVLVLVGLPVSLLGSALKGDHQVHIAGLLTPVQVGFRSLVQIALVLAGFSLFGMLFGYAAGMVLATIAGGIYISVGLRRPRKEHFESLLEFARYSWLGNLRARSFADVDFIVLGALVSPALVGVYQIAWNLTNFIGIFGSSITETTFPEMSRADAEQRDDLFGTVVTDSVANSGLFAVPGLFGALVVGDRLLRIYGDEFTQGVAVLGLLILAMLIYDYQNQLLNALNALDRPELSFRVNAVFTVLNFALNVVLVYLLGWVGAAIATVISASVGLTLAFQYLYRLLQFDIPLAEIGRQVGAAAVMAAVVYGTRQLLEGVLSHNVIMVLLLVSLGGFVYFVSLLTVSQRFRSTVANNLPKSVPFLS